MEVVPDMDVNQKQARCNILCVGIKMDRKTIKGTNSISIKVKILMIKMGISSK